MHNILKGHKIYDLTWITKTKFVAVTIISGFSGVRIVVCDIKKRSIYDVNWFKNTTKIRLLPSFNDKEYPLILQI